jgi:hypothetical protein
MRLSLTSSFKGIAAVTACSFMLQAELPEGWSLYGSAPKDYESSIDLTTPFNGEPSTYLKSREGATLKGFGGLGPARSLDMSLYRGRRIRLSADVKAEGVKNWSGLWMRVDGPRPQPNGRAPVLAFDNMQGRPITGTKGWQNYSVVLDVPEEAAGTYYGVLVDGAGAIWVHGMKIEIVGADVPTTGTAGMNRKQPDGPTNLSFDK